MNSIEDYFTDERILHYVCRYRAKLAKQRNRQHLIYNVSGNPLALPKGPKADECVLASILPPRRKWKKLNQTERSRDNGQPLNSMDKTVRILKRTVRWYKSQEPDAPFLHNLALFCGEIRGYLSVPHPEFPPPEIIPSPKKRGGKDCRPIALYPLVPKIVICLANRYLSERLDPYFEECSFAFRMPDPASGRAKPTHHDAFARIAELRCRRKRTDFWVAECDIRKFYDTVNHTVLKKAFKRLVSKANRDDPSRPISDAAIRIFLAYLDSYKFNRNVLPLNGEKSDYFSSRRMTGCYFGWVGDELKREGVYRSFNNAKIGVPQGGALSGLIANILLDRVDKALMRCADGPLFYARYCDDMIMMHPRKGKCRKYMQLYESELRKLKLLPHDATSVQSYGSGFWQVKSKRPYKWGPRGTVPWIGFVGYEISADGDIRVRKSSLKKEMQKQYDTVQEVMGRIEEKPRASRKTIAESITNRLIQMSVGRIRLHNYTDSESELCWVNGFRLLNNNKHTRIQMRRLDACRSRLLRRLTKRLEAIEEPESPPKGKQRQLIYYGKPFSYYYHALEKQ